MTDQAALRELDVRVAKALGYRLDIKDGYWTLYAPKGTPTNTPYAELTNVDYVWELCWNTVGVMPHWGSDLDAAASLPYADDTHLEITIYLDGITRVAIVPNSYSGVHYPDAVANSEAEARARVWLSWKEAQGDVK